MKAGVFALYQTKLTSEQGKMPGQERHYILIKRSVYQEAIIILNSTNKFEICEQITADWHLKKC